MSNSVPFVFLITLLSLQSATAQTTQRPTSKPKPHPRTLADIVASVSPTVVKIVADNRCSGTGFVVNKQGYIVTARHVIYCLDGGRIRSNSVYIQLIVPPFNASVRGAAVDVFSNEEAEVIDIDDAHDLAVLKATKIMDPNRPSGYLIGGKNLKTLPVAPATLELSKPRAGDPVFVTGYPLDSPTLMTTSGAIATSVPIDIDRSEDKLLDTYYADIHINHGNSGGAAFSSQSGKVIGVVTRMQPAEAEFADGATKPVMGISIDPATQEKTNHPLAYNSGIAYIVPTEYVVEILNKNHISFDSGGK